MVSARFLGEEQFHSKNYLLEPHGKMRLKSAPQKLNFLIAKAIYIYVKAIYIYMLNFIITNDHV